MPELPEVETVRRGLKRLIVGKSIKKVDVLNKNSFINDDNKTKSCLNKTILNVKRRGKVIIIELTDDLLLLAHLKMTGQLVFDGQTRFAGGHPTNSLIGNLPDKSTRVIIYFDDSSKLFFNDQRKFGWIRLIRADEINKISLLNSLGPDVMDEKMNSKIFFERLKHHQQTSIKAAILNQTVIAGVGNIYADESLWLAKIHPATKVGKLNQTDISRLFDSIQSVMKLSIAKGGSTARNYVDAEGNKGNYLDYSNVYNRVGKPCKRCGTSIVKIRCAGRGTHICPQCQKEL